MILQSIPSPGDNTIGVGPLELGAYGLLIAIGVVVAVGIARRRWGARGGNADDIAAVAVWAVPAGLVGARVYHVITDWHRFEGRWWHAPAVWEGGLGIPGGLVAGVLVGVWVAHRRGLPIASPAGRGGASHPGRPGHRAPGQLVPPGALRQPHRTARGLEINPAQRPAGYLDAAAFHPTFLYEAAWNLALAALLVAIERRWRPRPGQLFAGYVVGYAAGRLWVESLRVDPATGLWGVRVNLWVSAAMLLAAVTYLAGVRAPVVAAPAPHGERPRP